MAKSMFVSVNLDTLVSAPMYYYFKGNGGNMAVTCKRPNCQMANMCHFVPYAL